MRGAQCVCLEGEYEEGAICMICTVPLDNSSGVCVFI